MKLELTTTPTYHELAYRAANFATLTEALDYAALGETGVNFFSGLGTVETSLSYRELREQSLELAGKLLGLGLNKGDQVALVAETDPEFIRFFFACQYAGLVPVPLPTSIKLGAHSVYVGQLHRLLEASNAALAVASEGYLRFLQEASEGLNLRMVATPDAFHALPPGSATLPTIDPDDIAYIQYTSGSTRFPRGVVIKHHTAMANIEGMAVDGLRMNSGSVSATSATWSPLFSPRPSSLPANSRLCSRSSR